MILPLAVEFTEIAAVTGFRTADILVTAVMGMLIVFTVLILISVFITVLPRVLQAITAVLPEIPDQQPRVDPSTSLLPDEAMLAAIGFVLHTELQREVGADDSGNR